MYSEILEFNKYNSSELYTRLTVDVDTLCTLFFGSLNVVANNVLHIIFMVVMMFVANINLALIGFATIIVISIITFKSTKVLGKIDNQVLKKRDEENKEYSELYNKSKLTYLFKLQNNNLNKINNLLNAELKTRKKYIFIHHFPYWLITVIQAIGVYLMIYYALNLDTTISLGSIYLVLFYTKECKSPLEGIFNQLEELQTCLNSYRKINVILNEKNDCFTINIIRRFCQLGARNICCKISWSRMDTYRCYGWAFCSKYYYWNSCCKIFA